MKVEELSGGKKERFRQCSNRLLNQVFILKKKDDTKNDFYFIQQHRAEFEEFFSWLGCKLNFNENLGVIMLENTFGSNRLNLNKVSSVVLLILRLLYIEKKKDLSVSGNEMITTLEEVRAKIRMLGIKTLSFEAEKNALSIFRRYNLVRTLDNDYSDSGFRILIYPSILLAISNDDINSIYENTRNRLKDYSKGNDDGQEDADESQAD